MFDEIHGVIDKVEGAVGDSAGGIIGSDNVLLDPAPAVNNTLGNVFTAIIQIFAFIRNLLKL